MSKGQAFTNSSNKRRRNNFHNVSVDDRHCRKSSLDNYLGSQSVGSIENGTADKIKVQNGREVSGPRGVIDYGGETLENSIIGYSKSPIRKPGTAAGSERHGKLTELMKLLQNGKHGLS